MHDQVWKQLKRIALTKHGVTLGDYDRENMLNNSIVKTFYDQIENEKCVEAWVSTRG